jgi:hypothetical protein
MTTQRNTPHVPAARHQHVRTTAVAAGIAVLIAAGGIGATKLLYTDASESQPAPASSANITPSDLVLRELHESAANLYGTRSKPQPAPATNATVTPSDQALRELHESIAGQYGSAR